MTNIFRTGVSVAFMQEPSTISSLDMVSARRGGTFWQRWWKELLVLVSMGVVLAAPWILKPEESAAPAQFDRRLVVITPHNEKIRQEFGIAFTRYWRKLTGETLYIDWRTGGTSELAMMMRSDTAAAFQYYWVHHLGKKWTHEIATSFGNAKIKVPTDGPLTLAQEARKIYLESNVGIDCDLFFGGGAFDFEQQANAGVLVASDPTGRFGLKSIKDKHPEWFGDAVLPLKLSGESFYDAELRWVGTCLASLGLCYNTDVLKRLGIENTPSQWADMADPKLMGQIALSDPNKSGSVTKALEQIIQQQMQLAHAELLKNPAAFPDEEALLQAALNQGWERGVTLIQRISANSRYFTDSASKIPWEVAQGDAAAGMCIDFYGKSFEEMVRKPDGHTRIHFIAPVGGTSVGVDPVGMLRGAPEPAVATAFMEFCLSIEGQKLWNYRPGTDGGPQFNALRRFPVRKDFYTPEHQAFMSDGDILPFEQAKSFTYHPEWTASLFNVIRFVVKVSCLEVHDEQQRAWKMLAAKGFPEQATSVFGGLKLVNYEAARNLAAALAKKDKEAEMRLTRELTLAFRRQYEQAFEMAKSAP